MFDTERFVADCRAAFAEDPTHKAVREVLASAVSNPTAVLKGLGEPTRAEIQKLFHSDALTIIKVVWAPGMMVMPHNHRMWAVIGIYTGREDNVFWRRVRESPNKIEAAGAKALCEMDAEPLGTDIIHSVINPINKLTGAIHIYGGDFFAVERSEWDSLSLLEHRSDGERVRRPPLLHVLDVFRSGAERLLRQRGLRELIDIAVEDRRRVRGRNAGAQIFDHLIGLQHIGANLMAPADIGFGGLLGGRFLFALLQFALVEFGTQHLPSLGTVAVLRAVVLTDHDDIGGKVSEPNRGFGLVDVLPAGAAGAHRVDPHVRFLDINIDAVVHHRIDGNAGKGSVPPGIG